MFADSMIVCIFENNTCCATHKNGSPAKTCFFASLKGFTHTASTFHYMPETHFRSGIEGGTLSFHP
jgi:hypothetical protein